MLPQGQRETCSSTLVNSILTVTVVCTLLITHALAALAAIDLISTKVTKPPF